MLVSVDKNIMNKGGNSTILGKAGFCTHKGSPDARYFIRIQKRKLVFGPVSVHRAEEGRKLSWNRERNSNRSLSEER